MYAEITVRAKTDLPRNAPGALADGFSSDVAAEEVFGHTALAGTYESWSGRVAHAQLAHQRAAVFFVMDAATLKVHLEHGNPNTAIGDLREHIDEVVAGVEKLLDDRGAKIGVLKFEIFAEDKPVQRGTRQGWWGRVGRGLREDAFPRIYVPLATLVASLIFGGLRQAAYAVVVAIVALALFLVVQATLTTDPYDVRTVDQ